MQLEIQSEQFFLLATPCLVDKRLACHCIAQLEQLVLLDVLEGSNPAARGHIHLLVLCQRKQLLELVFRADRRDSHCALRPDPPDTLVWDGRRFGRRVILQNIVRVLKYNASLCLILFSADALHLFPQVFPVRPRRDQQ